MKNILEFIKKNFSYLILFLLGVIVVVGIFVLNKVSPFGTESLMTIDFYHQYAPMLSELFDRVWSGESLIYSFNVGLGIPFFRNFFNYLASPLNILIFLFNRSSLLTSFSIIIGVRSILSAFTMFYYLKKKFNSNNLYYVGISLLYAYSAYFTAYYWNIMWLDGMVLLPLIVLGIENIISKNNGFLYTISLTIMLYSNYFIGYMLCIFSCIYFICYLVIRTNKFNFKSILKSVLLFGLCSLIAGAINAWALIPMFDALKTTNATTGVMPMEQYYSFNLIDFIKNHLTGVESTVLSSDSMNIPNISCGILSIALFLVFLFSKEVKFKVKLVYILILVILMLSFYLGPLDYIWHGFHVPNDLPFRYSFIYSFVLITLGCFSFKIIKKQSFIKMLFIYIMCLIFITLVNVSNFENISNNMIIFNYVLISLYFIVYVVYRFIPKLKKFNSIFFLVIIVVECIVSVDSNWDISHNIDEFYSDYNSMKNSINFINKHENGNFYRIDRNYISTLNDGAWFDYYGLSTFSSMAYNNLAVLNYELGIPSNYINSYFYERTTPIYDLMFDIKYQIGVYNKDNMYEFVTNKYGMEIQRFKYNVGLMFGVNESIKDWNSFGDSPFVYQNDFVKFATGFDNTLYGLVSDGEEVIYSTDEETTIKITYSTDEENIYIYPDNSNINYIVVNNNIYYKDSVDVDNLNIDDNLVIYNYYTYDEEFVINEKMYSDNIDIYVNYDNLYYNGLNVYAIDSKKFIDVYNYLKKNEVNIVEFKENYISAEIELFEDKSVYTSIPYDKGWKVYSNGNKIETYAIKDVLLGFDLERGYNQIELKYVPPYLYLGISISLFTVVSLIVYFVIKKRNS